jgi:hypothetical protein
MWDRVPSVVRRYFDLDPRRDGDGFMALFSDDATVVDERETRRGTDEIRAWRDGPVTKYRFATEVVAVDDDGPGRYLVTGRITGDFPGGTADLRWDFTVAGEQITRLVIAP